MQPWSQQSAIPEGRNSATRKSSVRIGPRRTAAKWLGKQERKSLDGEDPVLRGRSPRHCVQEAPCATEARKLTIGRLNTVVSSLKRDLLPDHKSEVNDTCSTAAISNRFGWQQRARAAREKLPLGGSSRSYVILYYIISYHVILHYRILNNAILYHMICNSIICYIRRAASPGLRPLAGVQQRQPP